MKKTNKINHSKMDLLKIQVRLLEIMDRFEDKIYVNRELFKDLSELEAFVETSIEFHKNISPSH